jgi:tetratricopeptide (TPR) repeat protein
MNPIRKTVNFKFALILFGALATLAVGMHLLHGYQVKRNARIFVEQAEQAKAEGNLAKAADYLRRYLGLAPRDYEVRAQYGTLLADKKLAKTPKALEQALYVLEDVLRHEPDRREVRWQVIDLCMHPRLNRPGDALAHIQLLASTDGPEEAKLIRLSGRCHAARGEYKEARVFFEKAVAGPAHEMEDYLRLAHLLRLPSGAAKDKEKTSNELFDNADATITAMLRAFGSSYQAHLGAARYYEAYPSLLGPQKNKDLFTKHIEEARRLAADEEEVILAYADLEKERNHPDKVRAELGRGIQRFPGAWRMYQALTRLEMGENNLEAALSALRQGLEKIPENLDLEWNLAQLLVQKGNYEEAAQTVERLQRHGVPQAELDYLRAHIHAGKEEWHAAARLLERSYPQFIRQADQQRNWLSINLAGESNLLLARCYEYLGDPDAAAAAYNRVVARSPQSIAGRHGLARMEWALGRTNNAVREYHVLMQAPKAPAFAWIECAQLLIAQNRNRPQPDWSEVERILKQGEQLRPVPVEIHLLRAEVLAVRKEFDKACALLEKNYADQQSRPVDVWTALAALEQRRGNADEALALLGEAEKYLGERVELCLARCRCWARQGGPQAAQMLDQIAAAREKFSAKEQRLLLRSVGESYLQLGETKHARRTLERFAAKFPTDLGCRLALFDLLNRERDDAAVDRLTQEIMTIEGDEGALWRFCKARQLIAQAAKDRDPKTLEQANDLLSAVRNRRSTWGQVAVAQAEVCDLAGNSDAALAKYREAVQLGEQSPAVIGRTVQLLSNAGRLTEVDEMLQKLREQNGAMVGLERVAAEIALWKQEPDQALTYAAKAVPADSKDYRDHIWLGQIQWAAGKNAEAEQHLRRAIDLAPDVSETWVALVSHLARTGAKEQAVQAVAEAQKKLSKERAALALGQCYEIVGQTERAKQLFEEALAARPADSLVLRQLGYLELRGNRPQEAKKHFEQIISLQGTSPTQIANAKRALALLLAAGGDYQETVKGLAMLGVLDGGAAKLQPATAQNLADQRAKIVILARAQNLGQRRQAVSLLEDLLHRNQATLDERFLLAHLCGTVGEWPKAKEQYLSLLTSTQEAVARNQRDSAALQKKYGDQLASFCAGLLQNDALTQVDVWLAKLERLEPSSPRTISLRAQLLGKQGHGDQAAPALLAMVEKDGKLAGSVAGLLEQIEQPKLAEEMYKKHIDQAKNPEATLALAEFYGRQHRAGEGLALCEAAFQTCPEERVASTAVMILYQGQGSDEQCRRVVGWLRAAAEKNPKSTALLNYLTDVLRLQRDYPAMIELYRRILQQNPNDALVLNNLAWLLALSERNGAEALKTIQRAIDLDGPQAELLDTRAVIYLILGDSSRALQDLKDVIAERPGPGRYFHLALAQQLAKNRSAALEALQRAQRLGLSATTVDYLEQNAYQRLCSELDVKTASAR